MTRSEATFLRWVAKYLGAPLDSRQHRIALGVYEAWGTARQAADLIVKTL